MAPNDIINDFMAFTISLTNQPEEFNEGSMADSKYSEKLLWSAKALLNNGKLIMNSNFAPDQFTFNSESKNGQIVSNKSLNIVHELKGLKSNKVYFLKLITNKRTLIRKVLNRIDSMGYSFKGTSHLSHTDRWLTWLYI